MKGLKIGIVLCCYLGFFQCKKTLRCEDFKTGVFYMPPSTSLTLQGETLATIDSLFPRKVGWVLIRNENEQIEWQNNIGEGQPIYCHITWIDQCSYRLTIDSTKTTMNDYWRDINKNNGIVVTKSKIEGNCMHCMASMELNTGDTIRNFDIICKKVND